MNEYTYEQIMLNQSESFRVEITEKMQNSFRELSGDINELHLSDGFAKDMGYDRKLVFGMLVSSFYSTLVGVYLPGKYCLFQECDIKFNNPVFVGDELTIIGEVVEKNDTFNRIKLKARIRNQEGKTVSRATLFVGVKK